MRVLAVSLFIGRRTCSPGRRRVRRDLGDRPAIPESGHPAEMSLARAGASPTGVHPLERCPKFPSHPGMRSELSRSARMPWIKKPVENCFSQLRRSTISLLVGPRSRKPWRDVRRSRDRSGRRPPSATSFALDGGGMLAIIARSGGNVWVPALKAGAKVERAELVLVGSDHSVTTTHGNRGSTRAAGEDRAEGIFWRRAASTGVTAR